MKRFNPVEIIFCPTSACNLHCAHCFVDRAHKRLEADMAIAFLDSCVIEDRKLPLIERVGFSGGEPFLHMDFLKKVIAHSVELNMMFDQIMTNGDWWKDEADLNEKLDAIYQCGYDGKIGLSWDGFHNQDDSRMRTFIETVWQIFGEGSVAIQQVLPEKDRQNEFQISTGFYCQEMMRLSESHFLPVHTLPQTFASDDSRAWHDDRWFKEDYCQGPGNILFVHSNGTIAPCCGFANENKALLIGDISQTLEQIMENASRNSLVKMCYEKGLLKEMKRLERKKMVPGKTCDICTACDFISRQLEAPSSQAQS